MTAPTIFNFHPITGEFLSSSLADPDPMTPGNWLYPALSTTVAPPPLQANRARVWTGSAWTQVHDYRGQTWWQDGQPVMIAALGDPAIDGLSPAGPPAPDPGRVVQWIAGNWVQVPDHRGETWWVAFGVPVTVDFVGDPAARGLFAQEPPDPIPPPPEPPEPEPLTVDQRRVLAHAEIVAMANGLTAPIISRYPEAERAKWLDKEKEAHVFLALDPAARTPGDAPLLAAVVAAQFGELAEGDVLAHIANKAAAVVANAERWTALAAFVEGLRSRYDVLIDGAADEPAILALVGAGGAEVDAARTAFGL